MFVLRKQNDDDGAGYLWGQSQGILNCLDMGIQSSHDRNLSRYMKQLGPCPLLNPEDE